MNIKFKLDKPTRHSDGGGSGELLLQQLVGYWSEVNFTFKRPWRANRRLHARFQRWFLGTNLREGLPPPLPQAPDL